MCLPATVPGGIWCSSGSGDRDPSDSLVRTSATSLAVSVTEQKNGGDSVYSIWREEGITSQMRTPFLSGST